jgi:hypothetical protein
VNGLLEGSRADSLKTYVPNQALLDEGAGVVRDLEVFLTRYVILPDRTALPLAIWVLLTYMFSSFDAVPYLVINSPAPRCGKTRLLECLELVVSAPRRASNISEAALFRILDKAKSTLLLDEAETLNGKSERAEHIRQILNAGNRRGALVTRCVGQGTNVETSDFSVFGPKVLSGIGNFPNTITDRAIVVSMHRRRDSESVERFLYRTASPEGAALRQRAEQFVAKCKEEIEAAYARVALDFISDRDAEAWSPLFAILAIADDSRLQELRSSALTLTRTKATDAEDDNLSLRLLADVRSVWPRHEAKIFTADLIGRLKRIEDGPWESDDRLDARKLSRFLKPFGVTPATVQIGKDNRKGYYRESAEAAFDRYLEAEPSGAS